MEQAEGRLLQRKKHGRRKQGEDKSMFCGNCGTSIDGISRFCEKCGNRLPGHLMNSSASTPVAASAPVAPGMPTAPAVPAAPVATTVQVAQTPPMAPAAPTVPVVPAAPTVPVVPAAPTVPVAPASPAAPAAPQAVPEHTIQGGALPMPAAQPADPGMAKAKTSKWAVIVTAVISIAVTALALIAINSIIQRGGAADAAPAFEHELIQMGHFLTENMIGLATVDGFIISDIQRVYSGLRNTKPTRAVVISFDEAELNEIARNILVSEGIRRITPEIQDIAARMVLGQIPFILSFEYGIDSMHTTSFLQQSAAFQQPADPAFTGCSIVVLQYPTSRVDGAELEVASFVIINRSQEGTVIGSSSFIVSGDSVFAEALNDDEDFIWTSIIGLLDSEYHEHFLIAELVQTAVFESPQLDPLLEQVDE